MPKLTLNHNFVGRINSLFTDYDDPSIEAIIHYTAQEQSITTQIGYSDPVEYMMCNDGEYPPTGTLCHGETQTELHILTIPVDLAVVIKNFYFSNAVNKSFEAFCNYLALSYSNLHLIFDNVFYVKHVKEIPSKYISANIMKKIKKMKNLNYYKPRFWKISRKLLIIQPDRRQNIYCSNLNNVLVFNGNIIIKL